MEEANISNTPINQQSLITMDDMFIQIGKLHMEKINSDKIIEVLSKQFNDYKQESEQKLFECKQSTEQKIQEADNIKASSDSKIISINERLKRLEESNQLYQKNNKEFADKIQELHSQIRIKDIKIQELDEIIKAKETELEKLKTKPKKTTRRKSK